jgi:molybdate transport system regulatory protein
MQCDVRIVLQDGAGRRFMGIGPVWLLQRVDKYHSISRAARDMRLSYPKAIRMIKRLEEGLGREVITRWKGGNRRGGAELTPFGRDFIRRYDRMQRSIKRYAASAFRKELEALLRGGTTRRP